MLIMPVEGERRVILCTLDKRKTLQDKSFVQNTNGILQCEFFNCNADEKHVYQYALASSMRVEDFHFLLRSVLLCQNSITVNYTETI